jgi:four helix bundle protein
MNYEEWAEQVPDSLKNDPIWHFKAYPKALLLYDLAWEDTDKLLKDVRGRKLAAQLIDSAGSVSANIDEGFGRGIEGGEYIQFLRYALGSARETRSWYSRHASCSLLKLSDTASLYAMKSLPSSS